MADILTQKQTAELDTKLGKVKVQIPSMLKKLEIERRRTVYAGGLSVISQTGAELSDMFATLDVLVVSSDNIKKKDNGDGWDYDSISELDFDKLQDVYDKAVEWINSFRSGVSAEQAQLG